jgi:hypothetical protein
MKKSTTSFAGSAAGQSSDDHVLRRPNVQNTIQPDIHLAQYGLKGVGLGNSSGKTIQNETFPAILSSQALGHKIHHNVVGDQLPFSQIPSRFLAQRNLFLHRLPQNLSG